MNILIKIQIEADTPIHIGTGLGVSGAIDRAIIKDGENNVYIPGSSIKGRIKYNYTLLHPVLFGGTICMNSSSFCMNEDIEACCPVCKIFGSNLHNGLFIFKDATLKKQGFRGLSYGNGLKTLKDFQFMQSFVRKGIKVSRQRKVAEEKKLFSLEASAPYFIYETDVTGTFYPSASSSGAIPDELIILLISIKTLDKIGGGKSRGLGNINVSIEEAQVDGQKFNSDQINQLISNHSWRGKDET